MTTYFGDGLGYAKDSPIIAGTTVVLENIVWSSVTGSTTEAVVMGQSDTATFVVIPIRGGAPIISLSIGDGIEVTDYDPATMRLTIAPADWPAGAGGEYLVQLTLTTSAGVVYRVQDRLMVKPAL